MTESVHRITLRSTSKARLHNKGLNRKYCHGLVIGISMCSSDVIVLSVDCGLSGYSKGDVDGDVEWTDCGEYDSIESISTVDALRSVGACDIAN